MYLCTFSDTHVQKFNIHKSIKNFFYKYLMKKNTLYIQQLWNRTSRKVNTLHGVFLHVFLRRSKLKWWRLANDLWKEIFKKTYLFYVMYSNNKNINPQFKHHLKHDVLIFKVSFERPCLLLCNLKGSLKEFHNGGSGHECNTLHVNVSTF